MKLSKNTILTPELLEQFIIDINKIERRKFILFTGRKGFITFNINKYRGVKLPRKLKKQLLGSKKERKNINEK